MKNLIIKKNIEGKVVWRVNQKTKKGQYKILKNSSQRKYCGKITLEGFSRLPTGFYRDEGYGLTGGGLFLLQELYDKFGKKIDLTVVATGACRLDGRGRTTSATISHPALSRLNQRVRAIKQKGTKEVHAEVKNFLGEQLAQFRAYKGSKPNYAPGTLAATLGEKQVLGKLNLEDHEAIADFIPEYLSKVPGTLKAKKKLQVIYDSLDAGKKVYLDKILKEFRKKLKGQVQSESGWQQFLSKYILVLRNTYGEVLEKANVSLQGKFPDFMLIDPYSYLDIYEIKKPNTTLLRYDKSRDNYYWDTELSKAISQVENYLYQVQRNCDGLINDIRRSKSIDVSIVRPRGYIIAGMREQLKKQKMLDDFRILNESLKNVDVIFYDDMLQNLETFVKRIGTGGK